MLIEQAKQARTERELTFAKRVLTKIYIEKSGEPEFEDVVDEAKVTLDSVQQKLELLADAKDGLPPADPINPEAEPNQNTAGSSLETEGAEPESGGVGDILPDADQP